MPFLTLLTRPLILTGVVSVALLGAYVKGRLDVAEKYRIAAAKAEAEFEAQSTVAARAAYQRGLEAARAEQENEVRIVEIREVAEAEVGADDLCLSADVIDGLRALQ